MLFVEHVLPDIEEAGDHDGRTHSDDRSLVHEVHSRVEDGLPAPTALHPVAHLKEPIRVLEKIIRTRICLVYVPHVVYCMISGYRESAARSCV